MHRTDVLPRYVHQHWALATCLVLVICAFGSLRAPAWAALPDMDNASDLGSSPENKRLAQLLFDEDFANADTAVSMVLDIRDLCATTPGVDPFFFLATVAVEQERGVDAWAHRQAAGGQDVPVMLPSEELGLCAKGLLDLRGTYPKDNNALIAAYFYGPKRANDWHGKYPSQVQDIIASVWSRLKAYKAPLKGTGTTIPSTGNMPAGTDEHGFTFRQTRWGMQLGEVMKSEGATARLENGENVWSSNRYEVYVDDDGADLRGDHLGLTGDLFYGFFHGRLSEARYVLQTPANSANRIKQVEDVLRARYGTPLTAPRDLSRVSLSFQPVGTHVTRYLKWQTPDTLIEYVLTGTGAKPQFLCMRYAGLDLLEKARTEGETYYDDQIDSLDDQL
ncbi:MAG: hypothetical protein ABI743_10345 [bacterium]